MLQKSFVGRVFFVLLLSLLIGGSWQAARAQQTPRPTPTPQDDNGGSVNIREVRLPVTVIDNKKQPVTGFNRNDFVIIEDNVPQDIVSFRDETNSDPVYVAVLMDTSPSAAGKFAFEKEAAKNFIYTVMRLRKDYAAFVTFDHEVNLWQDFTNRQDLLDKAIDKVKKPGTQTALFDAVWQICNEKMRTIPGRRVIVIITDGDDTYSRARLADAVEIAQRTDTLIFAVSTKGGFLSSVPGVEGGTVKDSGDRDLDRLAGETGGASFFSGDILELERAFTRISKELRSQYVITYKPKNDKYDGTTRNVEVRFADKRKNLKIRTKKNYRAVNDSVRGQ